MLRRCTCSPLIVSFHSTLINSPAYLQPVVHYTPPHGVQHTPFLTLLTRTNFLQRRPLSRTTAYCRAWIESRLSRIRSSGLAVDSASSQQSKRTPGRWQATSNGSWTIRATSYLIRSSKALPLPHSDALRTALIGIYTTTAVV
jgi:hypothetical protein